MCVEERSGVGGFNNTWRSSGDAAPPCAVVFDQRERDRKTAWRRVTSLLCPSRYYCPTTTSKSPSSSAAHPTKNHNKSSSSSSSMAPVGGTTTTTQQRSVINRQSAWHYLFIIDNTHRSHIPQTQKLLLLTCNLLRVHASSLLAAVCQRALVSVGLKPHRLHGLVVQVEAEGDARVERALCLFLLCVVQG